LKSLRDNLAHAAADSIQLSGLMAYAVLLRIAEAFDDVEDAAQTGIIAAQTGHAITMPPGRRRRSPEATHCCIFIVCVGCPYLLSRSTGITNRFVKRPQTLAAAGKGQRGGSRREEDLLGNLHSGGDRGARHKQGKQRLTDASPNPLVAR